LTRAAIIINEVAYDDTGSGGADDHEFVELYNSGPGAVDISGWTLGGRDNTGLNPSAVVPGAVGSNTTVLAANDYYVIGNAAVASRDQTVAANFIENDAEQIELWNGAINTTTLIDAFLTEANKGAASHGALSPAMAAQVAGGYYGNFQSGHVNGQTAQGGAGSNGPVLVSQSRYIDGLDSDNNGRDFGQRRATPGAANSSGLVTQYTGPNVDSLAVGTEAPGHFGSFVNPRVVDPTTVSQFNPSSIPASPQGGNAITIWDTEFGGHGGGVDGVMQVNGRYDMFVYVDPRLLGPTDLEEWTVGIAGASDPLHNFMSSVNGSTGLAWVFHRDETTRTLQLIDFGQGGPAGSRVVLGSVPLTDADLGWHLMSIVVNGTSVVGRYDSTFINGTTASNLTGNIAYFSYREGITNNADPLLRPLTIDAIPEPSTLVLAGLVGLALAARRRR
jgi:hypothetical protein